jgi:hypothetical protein
MNEQFSTCMAWIWSCVCLTLLCTSTKSSNLKRVSGGGINSPKRPKSHWPKAIETYTIGWTDAPLFIGVGSSGAPPRHVAVANLLTQFIRRFIRQCVSSSGAEDFTAKTFLLANTWGWTTAWSIGSSGATSRCGSASLFCANHRIDRQCPLMGRQFI